MLSKYNIHRYNETLKRIAMKEFDIATKAREKGYDPELSVEIILTKNTAERVVGLLSVLFPDVNLSKIVDRINELESKYGKNKLNIPIVIAKEIANNTLIDVEDVRLRADIAVRAAVAYMTQGIVTAPLEGLADIKIKENFDGSKYLAVYYAGPIRSAGGTASAMSVVVADVVRKEIGLDVYKPTQEEINRYFTEVEDYYTRVSPKQYHPTKEEMDFIISHVPVEITGEPTEKLEVSNYKDLPRVETNLIRGGMCLVLLDGLPLKAEKLLKFVLKYGKEYGLEDWIWLRDFIELKKRIHQAQTSSDDVKYLPSTKYLDKLVGGRPVLAFPGEKGGFRLRYGRSFTNGLASVNLSKGVFYLLDYLALGTQVALEAPGKAAVVMPNELLENPLVRLNDGSVVEISSEQDAKKYKNNIDKILYLGDILIPIGEFRSNNHVFLPAAYDELWWLQELKTYEQDKYYRYKEWWVNIPSYDEAISISKSNKNIGLHPRYNLFWHDISKDDFIFLIRHVEKSTMKNKVLYFDYDVKLKYILETLGVLHKIESNYIVVDKHYWLKDLLLSQYSVDEIISMKDRFDDVVSYVSYVSGVTIRPRAPTYIGLRMGRPEKAKPRVMKKGSPQVLFPVGEEGGRMRNLMETYRKGVVYADVISYKCSDCGKTSLYKCCDFCSSLNTEQIFYCNGKETTNPEECSNPKQFSKRQVDVKFYVDRAYKRLGMDFLDLVKGVRGVFGPRRDVELVEKGILRAKYGLYVYKDGTLRYDATDIPLTHFRPIDIGTPIEKLKELGYTHDIHGNPLENEDQVLMLLPQDIIIPDIEGDSAADYLLRATKYIDDLLEYVYNLPRYYNYSKKEDLLGTLVVGLAPHTSAGIVGRIIGFSRARGVLAHPYWHAAKRRNADGDEDSIMLLLDAFMNFSRRFLPDSRGARTMDAPLVMTVLLDPREVDDEAWNIEAETEYSLDFYYKTHEYLSLFEMEPYLPKFVEDYIDEGNPYVFNFNVPQYNMFDAPNVSRYVEVPDMFEKVKQQLSIAEKIRAVDENKIAEEILKKHFLKDMRGNLRQFSRQKFRCNKCNEVYRRMPLSAKCDLCGGDIILTVSEGAIRKYTDIIRYIIDRYSISSYTLQTYELMEETIETMFGKKSTQKTLFG